MQRRTSTLTNRELLEKAEGTNGFEKEQLEKYRKRVEAAREQSQRYEQLRQELEALTENTAAARQKRKLLQDEITKTQNRMKAHEDALQEQENKYLQAVLTREKQSFLAQMQEKYGTIPKGEKAVRDDSLPVSTDGENRVSYTARTVKGAAVTPDEFAQLLDKEVAEGGLSYLPIHNDDTTQQAIRYIQDEGWEAARYRWSADIRQGKASAEMSAIGALLLNNAAQAGNKEVWLDILSDYRLMGTRAAQAVQAMRILKTLEPSDTLWMIEKSMEKMVRDLHLEGEVTLNSELVDAYNAATTDQQRDQVITAIQQDVAQQLPSTMMEMWTALRYVNMLGNFKTQVRNVLGNVAMKGLSYAKDEVAAALEAAVYHISGGKLKRTKTLITDKAMRKACKEDFAVVESLALDGGKYADAASSRLEKGIRDQKRVFKAPAFVKNGLARKAIDAALWVPEKYRKATNWAMEKGDLLFSRSAYARALAGYLKANGIRDADLSKVDAGLLDAARAYAIREAQEATFRDHNALTEVLVSKQRGSSIPSKLFRAAGQGVMPFRQTPANVLLRSWEYSPLGIVNSLFQTSQALIGKTPLTKKNGALGDIARNGQQITGAQLINSYAKTLTGTGLFVLGMIFSNLGLAVGAPDDDEGKEQFDKLNGKQNYAIKIGGASYTMDWLAPTAIPFFMGVNLQERMAEDGLSAETVKDSLMSLTDPMLEMSMLQGLSDTLDDVRYSDNSLLDLGFNALVDYTVQGSTNSLLGQLERGTEDKRMMTYTEKDGALPTDWQYQLGGISAKTPGWDYRQIPYIDAWGQEEKNAGGLAGLAYNLLSPGYYSQDTVDAVAQELYRLDEVQDDNVFPSTPDRTITNFVDRNGTAYEEYQLSAEEYVALAKAQGQLQRKLVEQIVGSKEYAQMSDVDKARSIRFAYKYAKEKARIDALGSKNGFSAKWMDGIESNTAMAILQHVLD